VDDRITAPRMRAVAEENKARFFVKEASTPVRRSREKRKAARHHPHRMDEKRPPYAKADEIRPDEEFVEGAFALTQSEKSSNIVSANSDSYIPARRDFRIEPPPQFLQRRQDGRSDTGKTGTLVPDGGDRVAVHLSPRTKRNDRIIGVHAVIIIGSGAGGRSNLKATHMADGRKHSAAEDGVTAWSARLRSP
jgi:hypothetical protein